jgi:lipopolysaccharide export system protein LptA
MKKTVLSLSLLAALLMIPAPGPDLVHNTLHAENKKIILLNADTVEGGETVSGDKQRPYRSVTGNVRFQHGTTLLSCERATEFEEEKKIVLSGNIVITDNDIEVYADNGVYYPEKELGELTGNVRGRLRDGSLMAKSRKAVVEKTQNRLWLYDNTVAWGRNEQLSGDILMVHVKESGGAKKRQQVDEVQAHRNALLAEQDTLSASPRLFNQMSGRKIVIIMNDQSKLSGVTVTGQAESLYHLYDEEKKPTGINYSSGNMIRMFFIDGKLDRAVVTGNVEGKQYPESYRGNPKVNLRKFVWRESEKPF